MKHRASARFRSCYERLPEEVRELAGRDYARLGSDPRHPSLRLKKLGPLWSVRVGAHYRALASEEGAYLVWFWIGAHAEYDRIIRQGG